MIDTELLRDHIDERGAKLNHIARVMGISTSALYQKLNCKTDFKISEAESLAAVLGLTDEQRDACFFSRQSKGGAR